MKIINAIRNIIKIGAWFLYLYLLVHFFGAVWGSLDFAVLCLLWNILVTLYKEATKTGLSGVREILKAMFTTDIGLPFTVYGCYCSPKYGEDGITHNLVAIDELDAACKAHDDCMLDTATALHNGTITRQEYAKAKNRGDLRFMLSAATSSNSANGIYLLGLEVGFIFRIVARLLTNR